MSLDELFADFLKEKKYLQNVSEWTTDFYKRSYKAYRRVVNTDPTKESLKEFVIGLEISGISIQSINCYIRGINSFLSWLFENGHTPEKLRIKQLPTEMMATLINQQSGNPDCLPIARMCDLARLDRRTYYGLRGRAEIGQDHIELRDLIQQVALEWPSYGYRRITHELARRGVVANNKLVLRLMCEDNLLCLRKRDFVRTTDSRHALPVYPNLSGQMALSGIDELWVADITYIRLLREFIYLAVILDAFSRRCIGWALERHLRAKLAVEALKMAIAARGVKEGLVQHSDRACNMPLQTTQGCSKTAALGTV